MKKTFKCICGVHLLEIHYSNTIEWTNMKTKKKRKEDTPELWIGIYDIRNPNTGRKYRKPKLICDFEVMGSEDYAKEMDFLMHFLGDILTKWHCRSNK